MNDNRNNKDTRETPFWVTARGARIALGLLYACAIAVLVLESLQPFGADGHGVERVHELDFTASYAIYGFVGCVILVLLGRVLRRLVMRDENYYARRDEEVNGND